MANFTHLPLEVIQQVASLCSFRDVVAIRRTCRLFNDACDDVFVSQWCFLNQVPTNNPASKPVRDKEALRKLIASKLTSTTSDETKMVWNRLAAGASQLHILLDELEELLVSYESVPWEDTVRRRHPVEISRAGQNIIGLLSTWTVLCDPTVNNFTMAASLSGLAAYMLGPSGLDTWDPSTRVMLASQISFCLAIGVLGNTVLNNMPILVNRVMHLRKPEAYGEGTYRMELESSFEGVQATSFLVLGCLPWLLRSDPGVIVRDDLPYPPALPLLASAEQGDIPLPDGKPPSPLAFPNRAPGSRFAPGELSMHSFGYAPSWNRWLRASVDAQIKDIARGEWVGYVSTSQGRNGDVPPPAHGVHFTSRSDPQDADRLLLIADGVDSRGAFKLDGFVMLSMGFVCLEKWWTGANGVPAHLLWGAITPLGIAGSWSYLSAPRIPMGLMWLYKKEWVRERTPVLKTALGT